MDVWHERVKLNPIRKSDLCVFAEIKSIAILGAPQKDRMLRTELENRRRIILLMVQARRKPEPYHQSTREKIV